MILKIENFVNAGIKNVQIKAVKHFWVRMRCRKGIRPKMLQIFGKTRNKRHWL